MGESRDPILENYCEECGPKLEQLIEYVRQLENAQIVAKEALDTLVWANEKLQEKLDSMEEKNKILTQTDIKKKMEALDNAERRQVNRKRLGE